MSEDVATAYGDMRELTRLRAALEAAQATQAALQSQLSQAHEATLLAQADAETLLNAVRYATDSDTLEERLRGWGALCNLARTAHPGQALADEVAAARAANAIMYEALRQIDKHIVGAYDIGYGSAEPCDECGEMRDIAADALAKLKAGKK